MEIFTLIKDKLKQTKYAYIYRNLKVSAKKAYYKTLSDDKYLNKIYKDIFGREINRENPITFNEKLQWLKLYWYDPKAEMCVDKYEVRDYLKSKGLGHLLNDLIAVYNNVDEINLKDLPDKFVLKCTHGSGCNIICEDINKLDWGESKRKLRKWMNTNYYWSSREWVYKKLKPRVICERFLKDDVFNELIDYKFFCFNGEPLFIMVGSERFTELGLSVKYKDINWNDLNMITGEDRICKKEINKPKNFDKMIEYAALLSIDFPFVRVDFYEANNVLYFGEMTFFPAGGFEKFYPESFDYEFGNNLSLPLIVK